MLTQVIKVHSLRKTYLQGQWFKTPFACSKSQEEQIGQVFGLLWFGATSVFIYIFRECVFGFSFLKGSQVETGGSVSVFVGRDLRDSASLSQGS